MSEGLVFHGGQSGLIDVGAFRLVLGRCYAADRAGVKGDLLGIVVSTLCSPSRGAGRFPT
jgi:hypothetical protein